MRKKVDIITLMDVPNFGSMLQAYATGILIEREGYDVEFIDYYRINHSAWSKFKIFIFDKSLGNIVKRFIYGCATLLFYSLLMKRLRSSVKNRFKFTRYYRTIEALEKNPPKADLFMTGSDQVWNSVHNKSIDKALFLSFVQGKKVAFSASVGLESFPDNELAETKSLLDTYDKISVRERHTKYYFRKLGYKDTEQVLDPTLMLTSDEWRDIIGLKSRNDDEQHYLLVYSVERFNNDFIFSQAKKIAADLGLKTYAISATFPVKAKRYGIDKVFALGTIKQFLTLIANADYVIASSFHGTAFSINFNKPFITILSEQFNIRMKSLIEMIDVSDRILTTQDFSVKELSPIDYVNINKVLNSEREKSYRILRETLNV